MGRQENSLVTKYLMMRHNFIGIRDGVVCDSEHFHSEEIADISTYEYVRVSWITSHSKIYVEKKEEGKKKDRLYAFDIEMFNGKKYTLYFSTDTTAKIVQRALIDFLN